MHTPVLLHEAVTALLTNVSGTYLDATFGRGGHTELILSRLSSVGTVIAVDQDLEAVRYGHHLEKADPRLRLKQGNFASLRSILKAEGIDAIHGALFDLGVSTNQLDDGDRGFSFQKSGPLDMRMDNTQGLTLAQKLETASESHIASILKTYGEERHAKAIAKAIVRAMPIASTTQLAEIVAQARPHARKKHPATQAFQALRIWVNDELHALQQALTTAVELLTAGGRLVVISFHSLEDRLVKQFIKQQQGRRADVCIPTMDWVVPPVLKYIGKVQPDACETKNNIRSRSAIMRIAEKIHGR